MSLLNDALEDLERRRPAPGPDVSVPAPVRTATRLPAKLLLLTTAGCMLAGWASLRVIHERAPTSSATTRTTGLPPVSSPVPPSSFLPNAGVEAGSDLDGSRAEHPRLAVVPVPSAAVASPPVVPVPGTAVQPVAVPAPVIEAAAPAPASARAVPPSLTVRRGAEADAGHTVVRRVEAANPVSAVEELDTRARSLLERGDRQAAVELWVAASADPVSGLAIQRRAVAALWNRGARKEAHLLIRHVRRQGQGGADWAALEARLFLEAGDSLTALQVLLALGPDAPRDADTWALEAALWSRQEDPDRAAAAYRRAIALEPDRPEWWLGLAIAADHAGRSLGARAAYRRALRNEDLGQAPRAYAEQRLADLVATSRPASPTQGAQP